MSKGPFLLPPCCPPSKNVIIFYFIFLAFLCESSLLVFIDLQGWGKTVVLGVAQPGSHLSLSSTDVLCSGKTLTGTLFGGLKPKSDVPILAQRYLDKVTAS